MGRTEIRVRVKGQAISKWFVQNGAKASLPPGLGDSVYLINGAGGVLLDLRSDLRLPYLDPSATCEFMVHPVFEDEEIITINMVVIKITTALQNAGVPIDEADDLSIDITDLPSFLKCP